MANGWTEPKLNEISCAAKKNVEANSQPAGRKERKTYEFSIKSLVHCKHSLRYSILCLCGSLSLRSLDRKISRMPRRRVSETEPKIRAWNSMFIYSFYSSTSFLSSETTALVATFNFPSYVGRILKCIRFFSVRSIPIWFFLFSARNKHGQILWKLEILYKYHHICARMR